MQGFLDAMKGLVTPAFVYDEVAIDRACLNLAEIATSVGCRPLFALKSFSVFDALTGMAPPLDGFAASSLLEARLARAALAGSGTVHLTTPGLRPNEMSALVDLCDYISFNSLSQFGRYSGFAAGRTRLGLRINPQLSFIDDWRYDPCGRHSKLGAPLEEVRRVLNQRPQDLRALTGIHFHSNCDSTDFNALLATVRHIDAHLLPLIKGLEWINLGGGYLFHTNVAPEAFVHAVCYLRDRYDMEVFIEPGASLIRGAGYLVASVLDIFSSDGKNVAVLDTSINHLPEVFEYQFEPDVIGDRDDGEYEYILAGCTCLAGDRFGEYGFGEPLEIGSRVVFPDVGAYSLVKAHTFNGVNLPTVYAYTSSGEFTTKSQLTFQDYPQLGRENFRAVI